MLIFIVINLIFHCVDLAKEQMNSFNVLLVKKYALRMLKNI
jgi:hypothetical protein